jgi:hypothetical protein
MGVPAVVITDDVNPQVSDGAEEVARPEQVAQDIDVVGLDGSHPARTLRQQGHLRVEQ